jgi:thiosulfate/3-mercaptopyruvate sulfurtransferase
MPPSYHYPDALVSTQWLAEAGPEQRVRLYDCTVYLRYLEDNSQAPYRVESGRADYDAGHIPGAAFLDLQRDFSDNDAPAHLRFRMLPLQELARRFAAAGIGGDYRVVLYSRGAPQWATRVWWMLRAVGFDDAAILDGGYEAWTLEQRPLSTDPVTHPPAHFTPHPRPELFVDREQVQAANADPDVAVINALAPDLHRGDNARYGRVGRIPGSTNVPAAALVDAQSKRFLDPATVDAAFRAAGADPQLPTVLYCGGGIAATLDGFLMHQLGYRNLSVYDASMSEWARDPDLPMETG